MSENKGLSSRAVMGMFYEELERAQGESFVSALAMTINSDQDAEEYKWLGMPPAMKEFIGGRQPTGLRENGITIRNKDWSAEIEIPERWLRRDKTGQLLVRVGELADRATELPAQLVSDLIEAGESSVCYDGQFFFDTDHVEGASGSQSNDLSVDISALPAQLHGTTTSPSPEEVRGMAMKAVQAMLGLKDDQGRPINRGARQFTVMVPVAWFDAAAAALTSPLLGGGDTNVLPNLPGFGFQLEANPDLTWTTKMAVFRTDGRAKPFILQQEVPVGISAIAEGSERARLTKTHLYMADWSGNAGYGLWQHACLVTAA